MTDAERPASAQNFHLMTALWKQRRTILLITAVGLIAGAISSYVVTPRFMSEVILFPAIANTPSKAIFNEGASNYADLMAFGEDEDAQHLMQVLLSDRIRERMAERFGLMEVYKIPPESKHKRAELYEAYKDHVQVEYTKYGTVRVRVEDEEPQRAADIANGIADEVDSVWADMLRQRTGKAYEMVLHQVRAEEHAVALMNDSLAKLRALGVHDYHTQSERFVQSLGEAIVRGDQRAVSAMEDRLKGLATLGGAYNNMTDQLSAEVWRLGMWRTRLIQTEADMRSDIPHRFLLEPAQPSDKKSYPVRWLMTVVCGLSAFLLALLVVVVQAQLRNIRTTHG